MDAQTRHMFHIKFRSGETIVKVDTDFGGGASQLRRVADYPQKMRLAKVGSSAL